MVALEFSLSSEINSSGYPAADPVELDRLPPRRCLPLPFPPALALAPNGDVCVGEPDRPSVVMESLRGREPALVLAPGVLVAMGWGLTG